MKALAFALLALLSGGSGWAQNAGKPPGYEGFQFARTRNIFDPNRQARPEPSRGGPSPTVATRQNFLMLTGTMVTEGKSRAFFSGGSSDANKVAAVGETVSGYKVIAIESAQVQLEKGGQSTPLGVGKQLTLEGMVSLPVEPGPVTESSAPGGRPSPPVSPAAAPSSSPPASGSDVLKKMMERRQQEMSK